MTLPNSPLFPLSLLSISLSQCDSKLRKLPWSVVFYPRVGCVERDAGFARKVDKRPAERDTATLW